MLVFTAVDLIRHMVEYGGMQLLAQPVRLFAGAINVVALHRAIISGVSCATIAIHLVALGLLTTVDLSMAAMSSHLRSLKLLTLPCRHIRRVYRASTACINMEVVFSTLEVGAFALHSAINSNLLQYPD